ncbi:MAG: methylamine utilization protein [Alphaproteobacteria bacterium]|nr:methylamine utilization protein [Alphaproteobacteria bacterium]
MPRIPPVLAVAFLLNTASAGGATIDVATTDSHGHPALNAVVSLTPTSAAAASTHLPVEAIIDQRKETFVPLVTVVRTGGRVTFTNNDTTMHQVYSFSPVKQFAFEIDEGRKSEPIVFNRTGIVAIGCNIHDHMIAYVFVTDSPWVALSDAHGLARIDAPPGTYRVEIWHPQLTPGHPAPSAALTVKGASRLAFSLPLLAPPPKHRHMGSY